MSDKKLEAHQLVNIPFYLPTSHLCPPFLLVFVLRSVMIMRLVTRRSTRLWELRVVVEISFRLRQTE